MRGPEWGGSDPPHERTPTLFSAASLSFFFFIATSRCCSAKLGSAFSPFVALVANFAAFFFGPVIDDDLLRQRIVERLAVLVYLRPGSALERRPALQGIGARGQRVVAVGAGQLNCRIRPALRRLHAAVDELARAMGHDPQPARLHQRIRMVEARVLPTAGSVRAGGACGQFERNCIVLGPQL